MSWTMSLNSLPAREIGRLVGALGLAQIEVDVAVADMAEGDGADAGQARLDRCGRAA